jgi:hypothetical protein
VHLDPGIGVVPSGDVAQLVERDGSVELAIDSPREVEVELAVTPCASS